MIMTKQTSFAIKDKKVLISVYFIRQNQEREREKKLLSFKRERSRHDVRGGFWKLLKNIQRV